MELLKKKLNLLIQLSNHSNRSDIMSKIISKKEDKYPQIYVYSLEEIYPGCLKIGYTTKKDVKDRINEQFNIEFPEGTKPYKLLHYEEAFDDEGNNFDDRVIHNYLKNNNYTHCGGEWFECDLKDVKAAITAIKKGIKNNERRYNSFEMRPEQDLAVRKTKKYFNKHKNEKPHFLWNAKMRFGKTFTTYKLAKEMSWNRILVLTYKPAAKSAWKEDLLTHIDFEGWQFISNNDLKYEDCDKSKPIVCFGSLQDYLGRTEDGKIKPKNEWVHNITWDCIVFDEYHYGAWRNKTKELVDDLDGEEIKEEIISENDIPIKTKHYLYLSGTPFKILSSNEFSSEQIFNWTYVDEQRAKENWEGSNNPYLSLPKLILMTYELPKDISKVALKGEYNEFDLNEFFKASFIDENKTCAKFKHKDEVQKWIDFITEKDIERSIKHQTNNVYLPFSNADLKELLQHTIWFLPDIASCYAMYDLLHSRANTYFRKYKIALVAGNKCGNGVEAIKPVNKIMTNNPLETQTITLTCGKLTTGVTINPWTGIFMLRSCKSPETYFQAAFRVQSPWVIKDDNNNDFIIKENSYIFDFDPNRSLKQIANYCNQTNENNSNIEEVVSEFIKFLPVLAYSNLNMEKINASSLLDIAMGQTTASLLAKRWNDNLLINMNDNTLDSILNNEEALEIIKSIPSKNLNFSENIEIIINQTNELKKLKTKDNKGNLSKKDEEKIKKIEKEIEEKKEKITEKLKSLITKLPIFIYLSDTIENSLQDIISPQEKELFEKVTGITPEEFKTLNKLGIFNSTLINNVIYDFKKCEEKSLKYTGLKKHDS